MARTAKRGMISPGRQLLRIRRTPPLDQERYGRRASRRLQSAPYRRSASASSAKLEPAL